MAEITFEATRSASQMAVARAIATARLGAAEAELVIDNAVSKLEVNLALDALERDLQSAMMKASGSNGFAGRAWETGGFFDDGSTFTDINTLGL